jgi:hypothetical protein
MKWDEDYTKMMAQPQKPNLQQLTRMLQDADKIAFDSPNVHELRKVVEGAARWRSEAERAIAGKRTVTRRGGTNAPSNLAAAPQDNPPFTLTDIDRLIEEGQRENYDPRIIGNIHLLIREVASFREKAAALLAVDNPDVKRVQDIYSVIEAMNVAGVEEFDRLQQVHRWNEWVRRLEQVIYNHDLTYEVSAEYVEEAKAIQLPAENQLYVDVIIGMENGKEYGEKMLKHLATSRRIEMTEIDQLQNELKIMLIPKQVRDQLVVAADEATSLNQRIQKALQGSSNLSYAQVKGLITAAEQARLVIPGMKDLREKLKTNEDWVGKVKKMRLNKGLEKMEKVVSTDVDETNVYCLCFSSRESDDLITCIECQVGKSLLHYYFCDRGVGYHAKCLGLSALDIRRGKWVCPVCDPADSGPTEARPSISKVSDLLAEADKMSLVLSCERKLLEQIDSMFQRWEEETAIFLQMDEVSMSTMQDKLKHFYRQSIALPFSSYLCGLLKDKIRNLGVPSRAQDSCVCHQPYVEGQMIMCDHCNDWFHYECMKLTSDRAKMLPSFVCSKCCEQANVPYPFNFKRIMDEQSGERLVVAKRSRAVADALMKIVRSPSAPLAPSFASILGGF